MKKLGAVVSVYCHLFNSPPNDTTRTNCNRRGTQWIGSTKCELSGSVGLTWNWVTRSTCTAYILQPCACVLNGCKILRRLHHWPFLGLTVTCPAMVGWYVVLCLAGDPWSGLSWDRWIAEAVEIINQITLKQLWPKQDWLYTVFESRLRSDVVWSRSIIKKSQIAWLCWMIARTLCIYVMLLHLS